MQVLKTLNHLNLPNHSGNSPQIYECFWSVAKTLENPLFWQKAVIGQSSSMCPSLSVRTVTHNIVTLTIMLLWNTENQSYAPCD